MKHYLSCMQCLQNSCGHIKNKIEVEYSEEGYYYFECPEGHKNFVVLQEEKYETLFQIGANAITDGYYREAVSSFTSSLERFYEFCVKVFCKKHNISNENMTNACNFFTKSSERQFGSFLFLYLIEFNSLPFAKKEDDKWRNFRNGVIHNGDIPKKNEAIQYGEYVRTFILTTIIKLRQKNYNSEIMEIVSENLQNKFQNNKYRCNNTTMCYPNILSLANGEIEKELEKKLESCLAEMRNFEQAMKTH